MAAENAAIDRLRRGGPRFARAIPLLDLGLKGVAPQTLRAHIASPWPGDAVHGAAMLNGQFIAGGVSRKLGRDPFSQCPAQPRSAAEWRWWAALHGFGFLHDLRAQGGDAARQLARQLTESWLHRFDKWSPDGWALGPTGRRVANWLALYGFFAESADDGFQARLLDHLGRQTRFLTKQLPSPGLGNEHLAAVKGWVIGALCLEPEAYRLGRSVTVLEALLEDLILEDGTHISRNPSVHFAALRDLIDLRRAFMSAGEPLPPSLSPTIRKMVPVLRAFRHGDGALTTLNGASEETPLLIDTALSQVETRGRAVRSLPDGGFERLTAGRAVLLVNTGGAAPSPFDLAAPAGLSAIEISAGRDRLIVSCGAALCMDGLDEALRTTAAASTLVVSDTNAAEVLNGNGIGREPAEIASARTSDTSGTRVITRHTGWLERYGVVYERSVMLFEDGEEIAGIEQLLGTTGHRYAIRFHLHPDVQLLPIEGGAMLKPPSGAGWRFRAEGAEMEVAESIYVQNGWPRRNYQLILMGQTEDLSHRALGGNRRTGAFVRWWMIKERG